MEFIEFSVFNYPSTYSSEYIDIDDIISFSLGYNSKNPNMPITNVITTKKTFFVCMTPDEFKKRIYLVKGIIK